MQSFYTSTSSDMDKTFSLSANQIQAESSYGGMGEGNYLAVVIFVCF